MCQMYVGRKLPPTQQQQAVARLMEWILNCCLKLSTGRSRENCVQKAVDSRMLVGIGRHDRQPHSSATDGTGHDMSRHRPGRRDAHSKRILSTSSTRDHQTMFKPFCEVAC